MFLLNDKFMGMEIVIQHLSVKNTVKLIFSETTFAPEGYNMMFLKLLQIS